MTESDSGYAAVDKGKARTPADEQTQQEQELVRPGDDHTPVIGVKADAEPEPELMPGRRPRRLSGPRSNEQDAEMAGDEDVPED